MTFERDKPVKIYENHVNDSPQSISCNALSM